MEEFIWGKLAWFSWNGIRTPLETVYEISRKGLKWKGKIGHNWALAPRTLRPSESTQSYWLALKPNENLNLSIKTCLFTKTSSKVPNQSLTFDSHKITKSFRLIQLNRNRGSHSNSKSAQIYFFNWLTFIFGLLYYMCESGSFSTK